MALTSSERSKKYRERKIAELGLEEYRRQQREQRQKYRNKQIDRKDTVKPADQVINNDLKQQIYIEKKKVLPKYTESSHNTHWGRVSRLYRLATGEPLNNDFTVFKDTDKIMSLIETNPKWKTDKTKIAYVQSVASILKYLEGYDRAYQIYSDKSTKDNKEITEKAGDIIQSDKESENYINWNVLAKSADYKLNDYDKSLIGLYTLLPPKRLQIGQLLTLSDNKTKHDKNYNYLVMNKQGKLSHIMLYKHKTQFHYPNVKIPLPKRLKKLFKNHIKTNKIKVGQPVFPNRSGGYYNNFSEVLTNTFGKIYDKTITINTLRHSYIINFLNKKRSPNQRKVLARQMLHSVSQQAMYDRFV